MKIDVRISVIEYSLRITEMCSIRWEYIQEMGNDNTNS